MNFFIEGPGFEKMTVPAKMLQHYLSGFECGYVGASRCAKELRKEATDAPTFCRLSRWPWSVFPPS